jgi:hypothetical protein
VTPPHRLWTLTKDTRTATCDVVEHPHGLEARYHVDDVLVRSPEFTEPAAPECDANDARAAFEALGWIATETNAYGVALV